MSTKSGGGTARRARSGRFLAAGVATVTLALGACARGDDGSDTGTPDATTAQASTETTAAAVAAAADSTPDTVAETVVVDPTVGATTGEITGSLGTPEACADLAEALAGAFGGVGDGSALGDAGQMFGPFAAMLRDLKGSLPADYDGDLDLMAEAYASVDSVLAEYDYDVVEALADPDAADVLGVLETEEFTGAAERLGAYFQEQCLTE